jgi:hypothetical protein
MGCIRLVRICAMVKLYGLYYMSSLILFIFPSVPGWSSTRVFFLSELIYIYIHAHDGHGFPNFRDKWDR